jgi:hypothetical protein
MTKLDNTSKTQTHLCSTTFSDVQPVLISRQFGTLFTAYSKSHIQFTAKTQRSTDGKSEGKYQTVDGPVDFDSHLSGKQPSHAALPLLDDGTTCQFGVIDIDEIGIDLKKLAQDSRELPLCVCESKSSGAHLYLFVDEPVPAPLVQRVLGEWATALGYPKAEIFPKQTKREAGEIGNAINLPYFGDKRWMVDENGRQLSIEEFLIEADKRIINEAYLETVKVSSAAGKVSVSGSYAGRNSYLNALGYKLRKQGTSIADVTERLNSENTNADIASHPNFADGPLAEKELNAIIKGLTKVGPNYDRLSKEYSIVQMKNNVWISRRSYDLENKRYEWNFLSETSFLLLNKKANEAKEWIKTQAHVYDGFVFDPCAGPVVKNHLNYWEGWAVEPKAGDWSLIRNHIHTVIAPEHGDYVIKWVAWLLQNPEKRAEVAIVLRGAKGAGKGQFVEIILDITGQHGRHLSSEDHTTGRFNGHFLNCIFAFADEAFWAGDKKLEGPLKRMITERTLMVEKKYHDAAEVKNMLKLIIATNEDWAVPATADERRFAVFDVTDIHQQEQAYFDALMAEKQNGGIAAMMHELMNMDLGDFHPRQDVPKTAALNEQAQFSEDPVQMVLRRCLEIGTLPGTNQIYNDNVANIVAYPHLKEYIDRQAFGRSITSTKIGRTLASVRGVRKLNDHVMQIDVKEDENGEKTPVYKRVTAYEFPPLDEVRTSFDPNADWPKVDEWRFETFETPGQDISSKLGTKPIEIDDVPF